MSFDYQSRKDLDYLEWFINELDRLFSKYNVSSIEELLTQYYDQSEVLELISNVNVEVIDNLTSTYTDKPLSAKQGKELKTLIDGKANTSDIPTVPTLVSAFENDAGYLTSSPDLSTYVLKSSIQDNLTSTDADKPLSANMGKTLQDNMPRVFYGTCPTGASTRVKVVTTSSNYELTTGTILIVKFTGAETYNASSTNPVQLKVNGGTAVNVVNVGTTYTVRYHWVAGETVAFVYDGTNYVILDGGIANTTYYGVTKLSDSLSSTSVNLAATANSVKTLNDNKQSKYYTEKEQLLTYISETIQKLSTSQTLSGVHLAIKNEFDLTSSCSLEHIDDVYYINDGNDNLTDLTTPLLDGVPILLDSVISSAEEAIQNRSKLGHGHSANEIDVLSNWGGNLHQNAQYVFEKIWEGISDLDVPISVHEFKKYAYGEDELSQIYLVTDTSSEEWSEAINYGLVCWYSPTFNYNNATDGELFILEFNQSGSHTSIKNLPANFICTPNSIYDSSHPTRMYLDILYLKTILNDTDIPANDYRGWRVFTDTSLRDFFGTVHSISAEIAHKNHTHGSISNDGKLNSDINSFNKIVVSDSSNYVKTISKSNFGNAIAPYCSAVELITDFTTLDVVRNYGDINGQAFYDYCMNNDISLEYGKLYVVENDVEGNGARMYTLAIISDTETCVSFYGEL